MDLTTYVVFTRLTGYLEDTYSCLLNHELILLLAAPWWRGSAHRTGWP